MSAFLPQELLCVGVAWGVATLAALGGLSGAFLLLPFQLDVLGVAAPVATSTNHLYNVVSIPAGAWRYSREGRLLKPLALVLLIGSLPGVGIGAWAHVHLLGEGRPFRVFVGLTLLCIGFISLLRGSSRAVPPAPADQATTTTRFDWRRFEFCFQGTSHAVPVPWLVALALVVGILGGAYGIGGGALIAPLLVSTWNLPVHAIAGAALLATFATSVFAVGSYAALGALGSETNAAPSWMLGLSLGLGGMLGTYTGARLQRRIDARWIEVGLTLLVTGLGFLYLLGR